MDCQTTHYSFLSSPDIARIVRENPKADGILVQTAHESATGLDRYFALLRLPQRRMSGLVETLLERFRLYFGSTYWTTICGVCGDLIAEELRRSDTPKKDYWEVPEGWLGATLPKELSLAEAEELLRDVCHYVHVLQRRDRTHVRAMRIL